MQACVLNGARSHPARIAHQFDQIHESTILPHSEWQYVIVPKTRSRRRDEKDVTEKTAVKAYGAKIIYQNILGKATETRGNLNSRLLLYSKSTACSTHLREHLSMDS